MAEKDKLDELEDELDGTEDEDGTEDGTEDEKPYEPPTEDEWKKHQADLATEKAKRTKANAQAKALREKLAAKNDAPAGSGAPAGDGDGSADSSRSDRSELRAARAEAKAALLAASADPDLVELALARLKPGMITFDDDDEPEGIEDFVEDMQEKYPRLFKAQRQSSGRPGSLDAGAGAGRSGGAGGAGKKLSYGQRVMAASRRGNR